ncbi:MAG: hypothetical protein PHQ80_02210 [Candidatus ainarchaeum sp.]|nr:hypothetical protein [Candidatus ainarchaeum sp.]
MKAVLLALLLVSGFVFSAELEVELSTIDSQPVSSNVLVHNCDSGGNGPEHITMGIWVENPFGERTTAYFYFRNFTNDQWVQAAECPVLEFGKTCNVRIPVYLGGRGEGVDSFEIARVTMTRGSTTYEAVFDVPLNHFPTAKELIVENKTEVFLDEYADVQPLSLCSSDGSTCCKLKADRDSLVGVEAESEALLKECRVDGARMLVEGAINTVRSINGNASACTAALSEIKSAEDLANSRACNSGNVATQIAALKTAVRGGNYGMSLDALNSAMSAQCLGGAQVENVEPGDVPTTTGGEAGTGTPGAGTSGTGSKPMCPSAFVLAALLPLAMMVHKWDF